MNRIYYVLLAVFAFAATETYAQSAMSLKPYHEKMNLTCETCHSQKLGKTQWTKPSNEACLSCHGSYEKVAAKTAHLPSGEPNPHASSHYGNGILCVACHAEHQKSEVYCNNCHQFKYTIK